jgi:hypothetical protein
MLPKVEHDPAEARRVQQIWLPLFSGPPKPPVFTQAQWNKMLSDGWDANLARTRLAVRQIRARGGRVIFHRLPSTGEVLRLETEKTPRALFWDRLLRETEAPGVYFEDHAELMGFSCPEWSHLSATDAEEYTRRFVGVLKARSLL